MEADTRVEPTLAASERETLLACLDYQRDTVLQKIAGAELDDRGRSTTRTSRGATGADFSLRWIVVHVIEETARHLGHMDIIREQVDGTTGY